MTRVAAVDCGTNSIRLLVADIGADGVLTDLDRRMEIVRLGQDVDRTGRLAPAALARTFAACRVFAELIDEHAAQRVRFVATSASRDASNRSEFVAGVTEILDAEPEVISGAEEAALSFDGATRSLRAARGHAPPPYLVVDIGGGSTEFVLGAAVAAASRSVDIGCVRLTERHLHGDPPTAAEIAEARRTIVAAIGTVAASVPLDRAATLVGLAGSVTTVAGIALGLAAYDPVRIHHSRIAARDLRRVSDDLLRMTHDERAVIPVMHPGRVDVIGAGALILACIVDHFGAAEVVVSEHDILDGIAYSLAPSTTAGAPGDR